MHSRQLDGHVNYEKLDIKCFPVPMPAEIMIPVLNYERSHNAELEFGTGRTLKAKPSRLSDTKKTTAKITFHIFNMLPVYSSRKLMDSVTKYVSFLPTRLIRLKFL